MKSSPAQISQAENSMPKQNSSSFFPHTGGEDSFATQTAPLLLFPLAWFQRRVFSLGWVLI
jgi:hypothetical protein